MYYDYQNRYEFNSNFHPLKCKRGSKGRMLVLKWLLWMGCDLRLKEEVVGIEQVR